MKVADAVNIEDLCRLAKRRLPKIAYDFIEGGVEDEDGLVRNEQMFRQHKIVPRYQTSPKGRSSTLKDQAEGSWWAVW